MQNHQIILLSPQQSLQEVMALLPRQEISFFTQQHLDQMIRTEAKRDHSPISLVAKQTLRAMSSGERKKAFLAYLLSQGKPILCLENMYQYLDTESAQEMTALLKERAHHTTLIQIARKQTECLPFINQYYILKHQQFKKYQKPLETFFNASKPLVSPLEIPQSPVQYPTYKTLVSLQGVSVCYGDKEILKKVYWHIVPNTFWRLVGKNGVGKTTLLSLITGDNPKAYGQPITLFDKPKTLGDTLWETRQKIGYFTPNTTELFDRRHTAIAMLLSGYYDTIGLYKTPDTYHIALAKQWLELLALRPLANKTFLTLTPTQQRLLLVARAMVKRPPLLILDEPTAGMDKKNALLVTSLVSQFAKATQTTIIYVSHRMEQEAPFFYQDLKNVSIKSLE